MADPKPNPGASAPKAGDTPVSTFPQGASVIGHAQEPTIKDTNKSLGSPRALMRVPAARKH